MVGRGIELWKREAVQVDLHRCGEVLLGELQVTCPQGGGPPVVGHDDRHDLRPDHTQRSQRFRLDRHRTIRRHRRLPVARDPGEPRRAEVEQHAGARGPAGRNGTIRGPAEADQRRYLGVRSQRDTGAGERAGQLRVHTEHSAGDPGQRPLERPAPTGHDEREGMGPGQVGGQRPELAGDRRAHGLQRHAVAAEPLRRAPVQVPPPAARRGPGPEDVGDQSVEPIPAAGLAHGLHEQVRRREVGEHPRTIVSPGERIGEIGTYEIDAADRLQEGDHLGRLPVEHLGQQVAGHAVVLAGEGADGRLQVVHAVEVHGDEAQSGRPALRPLHQPLELRLGHADAQLREQLGRLVGPEGEIRRPHLRHQPGEAKPRKRPRRVPASRHQQRQVRRRPLHESHQPAVHLGRADLVQVVQDEGDRTRCEAQRGRHRAGQLVRRDSTRRDPAQRLARPPVDDRHQRGRHRAPEGVRVVIGLVEAHPHPGPVTGPGREPGRREDRLAPARGGRDHGHRRAPTAR